MTKLTVCEYAKLKGVSKTAVYKKIKKLNTVEEEKNGRKVIYIIIDDEKPEYKETEIKPELNQNSTNLNQKLNGFKTEFQPDLNPNSTPEIQPNSTQKQEINIIKIFEDQLKEKDKQIERLQIANDEKDKQLKEQFERLTELLYRSQQLEVITHKLLGDREIEETEQTQDENTIEQEQKDQKKKGLFSRIFKRNKGD